MIQWSHKRKARHQREAGNAFQNVELQCDTMESQKESTAPKRGRKRFSKRGDPLWYNGVTKTKQQKRKGETP